MLYGLKAVDDHPCFDMQELFNNLFFDHVFDKDFNDSVFPAIYTTQYLNGYGKQFKKSVENLKAKLPKQKGKKKKLYSQFVNNNLIKLSCDNSAILPESNFNWSVGNSKILKDFMINCFESKLDTDPFKRPGCSDKPTHRFYKDFIKLNGSICPFCGLNQYKNIFGVQREDLDHYLYKGKYPLASVNMWNLVPTCSECNQGYKKAKDILFDGTVRKKAFYPYEDIAGVKVKLNLDVSINTKTPDAWSVEVTPSSVTDKEKVENWCRIYGIEQRYKNELAVEHDKWIERELIPRNSTFSGIDEFREFMSEKAKQHFEFYQLKIEPKAFLKKAFFEFVANDADDNFVCKFLLPFNARIQGTVLVTT